MVTTRTRKPSTITPARSKRSAAAKLRARWIKGVLIGSLALPALLYICSFLLFFIPTYAPIHRWLFWFAYDASLRRSIGGSALWGDTVAVVVATVVQYFLIAIIVLTLAEGERLLRRDKAIKV